MSSLRPQAQYSESAKRSRAKISQIKFPNTSRKADFSPLFSLLLLPEKKPLSLLFNADFPCHSTSESTSKISNLNRIGSIVLAYQWVIPMYNIFAIPTNPLEIWAKIDFCYIKVVISSGVACGALWKWQETHCWWVLHTPRGL